MFKKLFLAFIFFLNFINLYSQNKENPLIIKFENDTIVVKKTKIIQTSLYIKNNGNEIISGELEISSTNDDITLLKKIKQNIKLEPNDYIYIPVKAQLKAKTFSSEILVEAKLKIADKTFIENLIIFPEKLRIILFLSGNQGLVRRQL